MYMYMYIPRWVRQKTWLFWASLLLSYLTLYKHLWLYTCIYVHVDSNSKTYRLVPPPSLKVGPARDFEWDQRLEWSGVECLDYASAQSPWVYTRTFAIRYLYTEHASRIHRVNVHLKFLYHVTHWDIHIRFIQYAIYIRIIQYAKTKVKWSYRWMNVTSILHVHKPHNFHTCTYM